MTTHDDCEICYAPLSENCGCKEYAAYWDSLAPEEKGREHEAADAHVAYQEGLYGGGY